MGILLVVNGNCVFNFLQWAEERKVKVFQKGERVVCGSKGVCVVEEITTLDIAGVDKKREYYILKPLYLSSARYIFRWIRREVPCVRCLRTRKRRI